MSSRNAPCGKSVTGRAFRLLNLARFWSERPMRRSRSALALGLALAAVMASVAAGAPVPLGPAAVPAGHYVLDNRHASLVAHVMHEHVSYYVLRFDRMRASFDYDPAHPEATKLVASVDTTSLDVNGDWAESFQRQFLKADRFPQATFASTQVELTGETSAKMTGELTLMGVTRPVTFDVTLTGSAHEMLPLPFGQRAVGFQAVTTIRRSTFGSTAFQGMVGDEVTLTIEAEFDKQ